MQWVPFIWPGISKNLLQVEVKPTIHKLDFEAIWEGSSQCLGNHTTYEVLSTMERRLIEFNTINELKYKKKLTSNKKTYAVWGSCIKIKLYT